MGRSKLGAAAERRKSRLLLGWARRCDDPTDFLSYRARTPPLPSRFLPQGADVVEGQKLYARIFRALSSLGIRI